MYSNEFKTQAVRMANDLGIKRTAKELKVSRGSIHKWIKESTKTLEQNQIKSKKSRRKNYSEGYKRAALKLASKIGPSAAAKELGLYRNAIYYWRNTSAGKVTNSGSKPDYDSVASLKRENAELKKAAETFKEALRLFVKQSDSNNPTEPLIKPDDSTTGMVHVCKHCGEKYIARVPYQKYCSDQCRIRHQYNHAKNKSFESTTKRIAQTY